jgi:hypothetical protein
MYKQARGVLTDPSKKSNTEPSTEPTPKPTPKPSKVDRTNTNQRLLDVPVKTRPMGNGESYGRKAKATLSTEGTIGGPDPLTYRYKNKTYRYEPGKQTNDPKVGRLI